MPADQLLAGLDVQGSIPAVTILGLSEDSRSVTPGDLFIARPGLKTAGTRYLDQAGEKGAVLALGPPLEAAELTATDLPYLGVENPACAFSLLADRFYHHPSREMQVIGVTGTNGKTTTTILLQSILSASGLSAASMGTLGVFSGESIDDWGFTTPDAGTLQAKFRSLADAGCAAVAMEVSSHALEQHRADHVDFDAAVFTNLTQEHLDYHLSMADYLTAKLRLFKNLKDNCSAVVNLDDPHAQDFIQAAPGPVITYGMAATADLCVEQLGLSLKRTVATFVFKDQQIHIDSSLIGLHNLQNILAAAAAAIALGIPVAAIESGIPQVAAIPGRLETLNFPGQGRVIIDYAHTPDAYEHILSTVRDLAPEHTQLTVLFGCGGDRDRSKRPLMGAAAERFADELIITSDNPRTETVADITADILKGLTRNNHTVIKDRTEALNFALARMQAESILLILGKGREEYEVIGTEKIYHSDIRIVEQWPACG